MANTSHLLGTITPPPPLNASELQAVCDTLEACQDIIEQMQPSVETGTVKPGLFMWWTQTTAPDGWLICDGSQVSRTTYSDLFSVIGTTFGSGDGSTTFTLPDLRAAFVRGAGSRAGYEIIFGQIQESTSFTLYGRGDPTGVIVENYDKIESRSRSLSKSEVKSGSSNAYYIRPYNMALTPVIKY